MQIVRIIAIVMNRGFNKHEIERDACQLYGGQASQGYDWWWHSFTGYSEETGEADDYRFV